ncbi:MAG: hypothetical protein GC154_07395 [bacterium]|nr:hypothetical protein [bacterium]
MPSSISHEPNSRDSLGRIVLILLIAGIVLRAVSLFLHPLVPGINGAYYLVQARSILRGGGLGIPDFPLLFYIQAGAGALFSLFTSLENALLFTVKLSDSIFPALILIPVYLFLLTFQPRIQTSSSWRGVMLWAGLSVIASTSLLRMMGDFQKNSFALVLFFFYSFFLYRSVLIHQRKSYWLTLLFFTLICLTHLGATSMALVYTALFFLLYFYFSPRRKQVLILLIALPFLLILALALVDRFDPVRIEKMLYTLKDPLRLFGRPALFGVLAGMGRPGEATGYVVGNIAGVAGLVIARREWDRFDPPTRVLLITCSLCALFLASPLIHGDLSSRLVLMAFVPASIPLIFWMLTSKRGYNLGRIVVLLAVIQAPFLLFFMPASISLAAYQEMKSCKPRLPESDVLIVASHGYEWWAAWTMETKIAQSMVIALKIWDQYDAVYQLEVKRPMFPVPPGPGPGMDGPGGSGRPFPPPPGMSHPGGPADHGQPGGGESYFPQSKRHEPLENEALPDSIERDGVFYESEDIRITRLKRVRE